MCDEYYTEVIKCEECGTVLVRINPSLDLYFVSGSVSCSHCKAKYEIEENTLVRNGRCVGRL